MADMVEIVGFGYYMGQKGDKVVGIHNDGDITGYAPYRWWINNEYKTYKLNAGSKRMGEKFEIPIELFK